MGQEAKSCYLKSTSKEHLTVYLPHRETVILGRCPETQIKDTLCSRQQVHLYADYQKHTVFIQQLGKKPCGFNGFKTKIDARFIGRHGDCLEFLYGKYRYDIEFNPPPPKAILPEKRQRESDASDEDHDNLHKVAKFKADDVSLSEGKVQAGIGKMEMRIEEKEQPRHTGILKYINRDKLSSSSKSDDKDIAENLKDDGIWESKENGALLMYTALGVEGRSKIAAYDMDGTLIKTKSGLVFPKDCDDWQLLSPQIPAKLKKVHSDGYKIVVFTNQGKIGSGKLSISSFKSKIKNIINRINVPMQIFIATGQNIYRKPGIGMWLTLEENNESVSIDKENSYFVGDAAGRPKNWAPGKKKDHSLADRLLAINLGLRFYTPEEHFFGHKPAAFVLPKFNPKDLPTTEICKGGNITSNVQEVVLMVGCPASGKSHFVKNYLSHYGYVNRDTLGSWQKCVSAVEKHLIDKNSVVVDNTNPDSSSRQRYINVAKKHGVPVRCFLMKTSHEQAKHNNKFRELTDSSHAAITEMIINSYLKMYQPPTVDEGFTEVVEINFVPKFQDEEHRQLYEMYLIDK